MRKLRNIVLYAWVLIEIAPPPAGLMAQTASQANQKAGIHGRVLDERGGAIAGAKVTTADAAGKETSAITDRAGNFALSGLQPGAFTIRALAAGFASYGRSGVVL